MKKLFLILIMTFSISLPACALEYLPKYQNTVKHFGIGVYNAPKQLYIYDKPNNEAEIVEVIYWNEHGIKFAVNKNMTLNQALIAFVPKKNMAFFAVEEDSYDWCKIIYDQINNKTGWVKLDNNSNFYVWKDIINKYGRSNGLYLWADLPEAMKVLRTAPNESLRPNNSFVYPRQIKLQMLKGNWMLIKIVDIDKITKIGWFKWRNSDGRFILFPKLNKD